MPTYEYECKKCGHQFEVFQSIKDDAIKTCPKAQCPRDSGRGRVQRLISAGGGLLFKGSGFYITDYRSEGYKKAQKADTQSSSGKSDAKSGESGTKSGESGTKKGAASSSAKKDN